MPRKLRELTPLEKAIFDELIDSGEGLLDDVGVDEQVARRIAVGIGRKFNRKLKPKDVGVCVVIEGGMFLGACADAPNCTVDLIDWDNINGQDEDADEHWILGRTRAAWEAENPDGDFREAADAAMKKKYPFPIS